MDESGMDVREVPAPEIPEDQKQLLSNENPNLDLWHQFFLSDPHYVKRADRGSYKFHTVDASYEKWRATALWGPYGERWGLRNMKVDYTKEPDGRIAEATLHAEFYYPGTDGKEASFEIINDWQWRRAGETLKKLHTNTLMKALAYLGFSGDVWFGRFEDSPYREDEKGGVAFAANKSDDMIKMIRKAPADKLELWYTEASQKRGVNRFYFAELKKAYDARKLEIESADRFGGGDDVGMDETPGNQTDRS